MNEQIEAIRNEIKRLEEIHERNLKKPMERGRIGYAHGVVACCDRILDFLDTLSEEHDKDLSEKIAAAYQLGLANKEEQMLKEWLKDREGCFWDGVEEGKKAMKDQMMKDAVEAEVFDFSSNSPQPYAHIALTPNKYHTGDKVRIIIVKEDER